MSTFFETSRKLNVTDVDKEDTVLATRVDQVLGNRMTLVKDDEGIISGDFVKLTQDGLFLTNTEGFITETPVPITSFADEAYWLELGALTNRTALSFDVNSAGNGVRKPLLSVDKKYRITITGMTNAQIWFGLSGGTAHKFTSDGEYEQIVASGNTNFYVRANAPGTVSFTSIDLVLIE